MQQDDSVKCLERGKEKSIWIRYTKLHSDSLPTSLSCQFTVHVALYTNWNTAVLSLLFMHDMNMLNQITTNSSKDYLIKL